MEKYNKRIWLNTTDSHYTGSATFHDGIVSNQGKPAERYTFMEITDCHRKVRIHYDHNLDMQAYIDKLSLLRDEIDNFINHLK